MFKTGPIEEELRSAVGELNVRPAATGEAVAGVLPQFVVEPADEGQLAAVLSFANRAGVAVVPRGGGTKLGWGNPPKRADIILSTARLNRILEHVWADLTVTVGAGCTLQSLQNALAVHGQRLALDGLWPERATVGGALSSNDSGALRLRFGALRDLIIGVTIALPDGTLASSGGKVVKNVAGYDLPKLATGALGTLGVITRAVFRLHPLPRNAKSFSFSVENFRAVQSHVHAIQDSKLAHTGLQIRCGSLGRPQADILFEATDASLSAQEAKLRALLGPTPIELASETVWDARQDLWKPLTSTALIAKLSLLPSEIAKTLDSITAIANVRRLRWQIVVQATGLATLRLESEIAQLSAAVQQLRVALEDDGGSLVILSRPTELDTLDAWGNPGDALPLMRAVKNQLDPKDTLNPGRFVGGI
jgi:glycolate oxidase FAD binding subunit